MKYIQKEKLNRKILIVLMFFLTFNVFFCIENYLEEYNKAEEFYKQNEYKKAVFILEKIMDSFPEYKAANVLYLKSLYQIGEKYEFQKNYNKIAGYEDKYKFEMLDFLIDKNEVSKAEYIYDSIENNENVKHRFMKFLYSNGFKQKIINKYFYFEMLDLIEHDKKKAEESYFEAVKMLKKGDRIKALRHLKSAIDFYPENYIYHLKTGQIYADEKNFFLAERNFIKALELQEEKEIYINLFRLYLDTENEMKMYETAKNILDVFEVKKKLKEIYYKQQKERKPVKIIKISEDKIYLDKRIIKNAEIGDSFYLIEDKENLYDMVTGEKLGVISENVLKIRVFKIMEKVIVFQILEKFKNYNLNSEYILKREKVHKF